MIGQMQGKFQMEVVPGVGHMLQEVCVFIVNSREILVDLLRCRMIRLGLRKSWLTFGGGTKGLSLALRKLASYDFFLNNECFNSYLKVNNVA
jgi:hypothetical protein